MLIELSVSSERVNIDPLNQNDELYEQFIVDQGTKNVTSGKSESRYGMGYELRVERAKQRAEAERLNKEQNSDRPSHSDRPFRPDRPDRPERPGRPERPNRPGR